MNDLRSSLAEYKVPEHIHDALVSWVEERNPPGGFLQAVLCNDLKEAFVRADETNRNALFEIVTWLYNEAPSSCWGSPECVHGWCGGEYHGRLEF